MSDKTSTSWNSLDLLTHTSGPPTQLESDCIGELVRLSDVFDLDRISKRDLRVNRSRNIPSILFNGALDSLLKRGMLEKIYEGEEEFWVLTGKGALFAYEKQVTSNQIANKGDGDRIIATANVEQDIPAADRFVSVDHNSRQFSDADQALEKLEESIKDSNELSVQPDERLALMREIAGFRDYIKLPSVRVSAIWSAVSGSGTLGWLRSQSLSGIVQAAAQAAVNALLKLVGLG
jgi:hypothetical protein